jgi:hypothetical protein
VNARSRSLPWILAASASALVAAGVYVSGRRPASPSPPSPSAAASAPPRISSPVPAARLPTPALGECLARLPASPDFQSIADFAEQPGELRLTWSLPDGLPSRAGAGEAPPSAVVRLELAAGSLRQTLRFGAHIGRPWARELSFCRGTPPAGPCAGQAPAPAPQGVVSEFSMEHWEGYLGGAAARWMLVRTPSAVVLLKATGRAGLGDADRGLCADDLWRRLLEIRVAPEVVLHEQVLVGDPPTTFDCLQSYRGDARCAG